MTVLYSNLKPAFISIEDALRRFPALEKKCILKHLTPFPDGKNLYVFEEVQRLAARRAVEKFDYYMEKNKSK